MQHLMLHNNNYENEPHPLIPKYYESEPYPLIPKYYENDEPSLLIHQYYENELWEITPQYHNGQVHMLIYDKPMFMNFFSNFNIKVYKFKFIGNYYGQKNNRYIYLFTDSLFSTNIKCQIIKYSFQSNFMQHHDHFNYWLEQHLNSISSFSFNYNICRRKKSPQKKCQKKQALSNSTDNIDNNNTNFKNLFCAGGRHKKFFTGNIVYDFLQRCTIPNLFNDENYFLGKKFELQEYKLFDNSITNESSTTSPIFVCNIPLSKLTHHLNMQELQDIGKLHGIYIPHQITKKTVLTYFHNHHCSQCDLYVSVLTEHITNIKIGKKKIT